MEVEKEDIKNKLQKNRKYRELIETLLLIDYQNLGFTCEKIKWEYSKFNIIYNISGEDNMNKLVRTHFINQLSTAEISSTGTIDYVITYTIKFDDLPSLKDLPELLLKISDIIDTLDPEPTFTWGSNGGLSETIVPSKIFNGYKISGIIQKLISTFDKDIMNEFKSIISELYLSEFDSFFKICMEEDTTILVKKYYIFDFDYPGILINDFALLNNNFRFTGKQFEKFMKLIFIGIPDSENENLINLKDTSGYGIELEKVPLTILQDITEEFDYDGYELNLDTLFSINEILNMRKIEPDIDSIFAYESNVKIIGAVSEMMKTGYSKCIVTLKGTTSKRLMNIPEIFFKDEF